MALYSAIFLWFFAAFHGFALGQRHSDLTNLVKNLTTNYNKHVRPTFDLRSPTRVYLSFNLVTIKEFDEKYSRLAIAGVFSIHWNDFQMKWNPEDHAQIKSFLIPQSEVWIPEIFLVNGHTKTSPFGFDRMNIRVTSFGNMHWTIYDVFESVCDADVTYFPFDKHTCIIYFQPWSYLPNQELTIVNSTSSVILDYYYDNSMWDLLEAESSIEKTELFQVFRLKITFKRRPMFHVFNILVPISIMGLLDVLVFVLPAESGERVGFSITVLLAMAVYLTIVADNLPSSSVPSIPVLCYILVSDLLICGLVTVCTIISLRFYYKPENEVVPSWIKCIVWTKCPWKRLKKNQTRTAPENTETIQNESLCIRSTSPIQQQRNCSNAVYRWKVDNTRDVLPPNLSNKEKCLNQEHGAFSVSDRNESEAYSIEWQDVAHFSDSAFFILFLVTIVAKNIITFIVLCHLF